MKISYHAWLRQKTHLDEEQITIKDGMTLEQILSLLRNRGNPWDQIFTGHSTLKFAVNGVLLHDRSTIIHNKDQLSIFPPFTGG